MPDTKVRINLNSGVIPTIRSETINVLPNKRDLRANRKYNIQTSGLIATSTPKKPKLVENYNINIGDTSIETDILEGPINPNDKSIQ